jgi:hypothetical protein
MLGSDLFPRDSIYSLEAPSDYLGPQAVLGYEHVDLWLSSSQQSTSCNSEEP